MCIFYRVVHYLVHISAGSEINSSVAQTYSAKDSPFNISNPPKSNQLSVAVQLATDAGYVSRMSEVFSFNLISGKYNISMDVIFLLVVITFINVYLYSVIVDMQNSNPVVVGVNTGWTFMFLVLLVVGLSAGLVYFVIRHRNLQNSFVQFANSRYDTRSGSATFTGVDSLG